MKMTFFGNRKHVLKKVNLKKENGKWKKRR